MKLDEAQLVKDCLNKDEKAYRRLYDLYAGKMYGVCRRYTSSDSAAEDVMHDGFIKVFDNLHKLRNTSSLEAWIRKVMIYTAVNANRHDLPLADNDSDTNSFGDSYSSGDEILAHIDASIIVDEMQKLPDSYRSALNLCEVEGYTVQEAAKMLGIKDTSLRTTLIRAKKILVKKLRITDSNAEYQSETDKQDINA